MLTRTLTLLSGAAAGPLIATSLGFSGSKVGSVGEMAPVIQATRWQEGMVSRGRRSGSG
jgi:hypothetical protein